MPKTLNVGFIRAAGSATVSDVFENERYDVAVLQIESTADAFSVALEGRVDAQADWTAVASANVSVYGTPFETMTEDGIYEFGVAGLREIRVRVISVTNGSVSASGVFWNSADNTPYPKGNPFTFLDPKLFVKGAAEVIFTDPKTGAICGYEKVLSDAAVQSSVNLGEITGGIGNRLVGVIPDSARITGSFTEEAFSLRTRAAIMGGNVAYNASVPICEKVTASSPVLTVSRDPVPYWAEDVPEKKYPTYAEVRDVDIASVKDAEGDAPVKALTVGIEPVQDLHGYDAPWPAGGGKNLAGFWQSGYITNNGGISQNNTNALSKPIALNNGDSVVMSGGSGRGYAVFSDEQLLNMIDRVGSNATTYTASSVCYFVGWFVLSDSTHGQSDMDTGKCQIERGSTATSYAPYSNICSIMGWTGAKVTRCGSGNILGKRAWTSPAEGITCDNETDDCAIILNGTSSKTIGFTTAKCKVIPGQTYTARVSGASSTLNVNFRGMNDDGTKLTYVKMVKAFLSDGTFTFVADGSYNTVDVRPTVLGTTQVSNKLVQYSLSIGSVPAEFTPNTIEVIDITFPTEAGTVYGGTLDVTNGVLTVDRAMVDLGTGSWYKSSATSSVGGSTFSKVLSAIGDGMKPRSRYTENTMLSDMFSTCDSSIWFINNMPDHAMFANETSLFISASEFETSSDFIEAVAGHQLVYELAEPVTYDLTPVEVRTLLGVNNVWADTGDVELFRYQTDKYIIRKIPTPCRCYIKRAGDTKAKGVAYYINSETREIEGFVATPGAAYEVSYFVHNPSARSLAVPTEWNPVAMCVTIRYGVYRRQGPKDSHGAFYGWMMFIVPLAILTGDAGVEGSQTGHTSSSGTWTALPDKKRVMPMFTGNATPVAYYVLVPCAATSDLIEEIVLPGGGVTVKVGQRIRLPLKVVTAGEEIVTPDYRTINYISADDGIAAVDEDGYVTGVAAGETVVTAFVLKKNGTVTSTVCSVAVSGASRTLSTHRSHIIIEP